MSVDLRCPDCRSFVCVSGELQGLLVRCDACGATFTAMCSVAVVSQVIPEATPPPLAGGDPPPPSLQGQSDVLLPVQVLRDSLDQLCGATTARLSPEGLYLGTGKHLTVVKPRECTATHRRGNLFTIETDGRHLELRVGGLGVYGERLARDLAALLNGEGGRIVLDRYRIEWCVRVLALLPLGAMALALGGVVWGALGGGMAGLNLYIAQRDWLPMPVRLGAMFLVSVASYALVFSFPWWGGWLLP